MQFHTYVGRKGNYIEHIGYENGKRFHERKEFKPSIYYETISGDADSTSIFGQPLKQRKFDSISDWSKFFFQNKDILAMYSDLDPVHQFIAKEYPTALPYDQKNIRVWWIDIEVNSEEGFPYPHEAKWPVVSITIYDTKRDEYIVLGLKDYVYDAKRLPLNTLKVSFKKCINERDLLIKFIDLHKALQPDIIIAHNGEGFDFPYNINRIDNLQLNSNDLSPIGKTTSKYTEVEDKFVSGRSEYYNSIEGISLLDNMLLYKKYIATPRESYSLSNLAVEDLGMDKINYEEYDNLTDLYEKDYTKFIDYNITDVYLMVMLNKKNGYLDIHIRNMYKSKCSNFEEPMSPVKLWDLYIYQSLQAKNIQVQPQKKDVEKFSYPGAFVIDPMIGKHKWVLTEDLNSLYPHIHMEWNISPETLVENLTVSDWLQSLSESDIDKLIDKAKTPEQARFLRDVKELNSFGYAIPPIDKDQLDDRMLNQLIPTHPEYIMSANGYYYRKDKIGCIPELLIENYNERKAIKQGMEILKKQQEIEFKKDVADRLAADKVAEQGIKIMMNAEYGALANVFFRHCRYELPSSITMGGQLVLLTLVKAVKKEIPELEIIFGDTDSLGLGCNNIVKKHCVGFSDEQIRVFLVEFEQTTLQPLIQKTYNQLAEFVGANKNYMKMAREKIISDGIWTAKKHYAFRMIMEDTVVLKEPKYGFKGLECVKSSIPKAIRAMQKNTIQIMLTDESKIAETINKSKEMIMKLTPEEIAFPKTCNGLYKYADGSGGWIKGAQAHVKAAMTYNKYILKNKLVDSYPIIKDGEKIRFVWLKTPNPFDSETFGFMNRLPKDDAILSFVDYETIYHKAYYKIMVDMLEKINLQHLLSNVVSLEDYF